MDAPAPLYLPFLSSKQKLERDKGLEIIKDVLRNPGSGEIVSLEQNVLGLVLNSDDDGWEGVHGGLMASVLLVEAGMASDKLCDEIQRMSASLLEHQEPRVRLATGDVIGHLCRSRGPQVFSDLRDVLISGIKSNMERDTDATSESSESHAESAVDRDGRPIAAIMFLSTEHSLLPCFLQPLSPSSAVIFHDTAGWKALETYMIALQKAVIGCGKDFAPFVTSDLLQLIFSTLSHTNRFVRETGYKTVAAIVKCPDLSESTTNELWPAVANHLATGLADNWSQVRMAASVATREFLLCGEELSASSFGEKDLSSTSSSGMAYLSVLLPPMCLNRYYIAEGVKLYSQETWRRATGGRGVALVEEHLDKVVDFYVSQSEASNHAVREASCTCIAELGTKVSSDCLRPYVKRLITVLLECFRDDSWPVRDAACLASGNFVSCFPEECRSLLEELFPLFLSNLEDSIPSVRQGAAVALVQLYTAYGSEVEGKIFSTIQERLPQVADQPSHSSSSIDPAPATFGVVRRAESGKADVPLQDVAHTNQQMYSCGSLAPKMKRGGCMDSTFHRTSQPWERSEGCVHLVAMLSQQPALSGRVESLLPVLAEAARAQHYSQHLNYLEAVLKQLPTIAKALGKRSFKRHLEGFLEPIFYSLTCDSALVKAAGVQCLQSLTQQIGKMIMRGRVEQQRSQWVALFDQTIV